MKAWRLSASCVAANDFLPIGAWTMPLLSTRNSILPAFSSFTAFVTSIVTVPALGFGITLRDDEDADCLPRPVRQGDRATHNLVRMLGIDAQTDRHVHRLVELRERRAFDLLDGRGWRVQLLRLECGGRRAVLLAVRAHQPSTVRPMERAVSAIMLIAPSRSVAFRSCILISAIFLSWARVTFPTFSRFEVGEPFSIPASFFRSTAAGGVLVMNVKVRSL